VIPKVKFVDVWRHLMKSNGSKAKSTTATKVPCNKAKNTGNLESNDESLFEG
jgi:hypothetical protein